MSREAFEAWATQHGITFVSRSHGQATTDTVSRDALMALWQAARAGAYERAAKVCRKIADNPEYGDLFADGAVECEEAIRALAKEAGK